MALDLAVRTRLAPVAALAGCGGARRRSPTRSCTATLRARAHVAIVLLFAAAALCHAALTRGTPVAARAGRHRPSCSASRSRWLGVAHRRAVRRLPLRRPARPAAVRRAGGHRIRVDDARVAGRARGAPPRPPVRRARRARRLGASRRGTSSSIRRWCAPGYWHWAPGGRTLPGVPHVPLSDYAGWFAVALVISYLLQRALARHVRTRTTGSRTRCTCGRGRRRRWRWPRSSACPRPRRTAASRWGRSPSRCCGGGEARRRARCRRLRPLRRQRAAAPPSRAQGGPRGSRC